MDEYLNFLKGKWSEENEETGQPKDFKEAIRRLNFWKLNYFSFIRQGFDLFLAGDQEIEEARIELLDGQAGYQF